MKIDELNKHGFSTIREDELIQLGGGDGFAYDFGRFLRYMGVYIANGAGMPGTYAAVADAVYNHIKNQ
jgi:hypothetical protein